MGGLIRERAGESSPKAADHISYFLDPRKPMQRDIGSNIPMSQCQSGRLEALDREMTADTNISMAIFSVDHW